LWERMGSTRKILNYQNTITSLEWINESPASTHTFNQTIKIYK
jgi:hypothetical protein